VVRTKGEGNVLWAQNRSQYWKFENQPNDRPAEETYKRGASLFDYNAFSSGVVTKTVAGKVVDTYDRAYPEVRWNEHALMIDPSAEMVDPDKGDFRLKSKAKLAISGLGSQDSKYPKYCGAYAP